MFVIPSWQPCFLVDLRLLVKECIYYIGITLDFFVVHSMIFSVLLFFLPVFGSLQTSIQCIVGELAGGRSVAVAAGVTNG